MKRRDFLKSTGLVAGASVLGGMSVARGANVGGDDVIKIALVGCGGRGRGAVADRFSAKDNVKLVAIADAFEANAKSAAEAFQNMDPDRVDLGDRVFWGFDAYKKAIDECDQALIVTSPGFRPIHYKYAIEQGKHVFMEKPCCVDARGYKMAMETNKLADEKGLTVVVGFQRHYELPYVQMVEQIKEGKIGEIMYSRVYWNGDGIWERGRQNGDTEMMYQMRNWYHFNWLCGDGIVEQHCHNIDVANWVHSLGDPMSANAHPIKCNAMGGREVRKFPRFKNSGHRYDHYVCEFTYADGSQMFSQCRHQGNCWNNVSETFYGTKGWGGRGWLDGRDGNQIWRFDGNKEENKVAGPYQYEHHMQAKWIREGVKHNDGWHAANSSMTSNLGRMAACSGKELSWDDAVNKGADEFPYDEVAKWEKDPNLFWETNPPVMPDTTMPVLPKEGEIIYENSVPVPGEWKWHV